MEQTTNESNVAMSNESQAVEVLDTDRQKLNLSQEQQAVFDSILNREFKKMAQRQEKKVQAKLEEIEKTERFKTMTDNEKKDEEMKELKAKIADYEHRDLINQFKIELGKEGLPQNFADAIPISTADEAMNALKFIKAYKAEIIKPYEDKIATLEKTLKAAEMRSPAPKASTMPQSRQASSQFEELFNTIKNKN